MSSILAEQRPGFGTAQAEAMPARRSPRGTMVLKIGPLPLATAGPPSFVSAERAVTAGPVLPPPPPSSSAASDAGDVHRGADYRLPRRSSSSPVRTTSTCTS